MKDPSTFVNFEWIYEDKEVVFVVYSFLTSLLGLCQVDFLETGDLVMPNELLH